MDGLPVVLPPSAAMSPSMQHTIAHAVSVTGYGYWSGNEVRVEFRPAKVDSGITFIRHDIGRRARVSANVYNRTETPRRTNLCSGQVQVEMVEHLLAALAGLQIDNCEVWVDQAEMPGGDGSARAFVKALDSTQRVRQNAECFPVLRVTETVKVRDGAQWVEARPVVGGGFLAEYHLDYPHTPAIGKQAARFAITPQVFRRDIASCRTFVLEHEAKQMLQLGYGKRVTPRDLLLFGEQGLQENTLRYSNECARHKVLDMVGDLALSGCRLEGHFIAHQSGHKLNALLAKTLLEKFSTKQALQKIA